MSKVSLRHPDVSDIDAVAARLRASDKEELNALRPGLDYGLVLHDCVALSLSSWCRTLWYADAPLAITGVAPNGDGSHAPWLVGTDNIHLVPVSFIRTCRMIVDTVYRPRFSPLRNYVDVRQEASLRFLSALGFELCKAEHFGPEGNMFRAFRMEA